MYAYCVRATVCACICIHACTVHNIQTHLHIYSVYMCMYTYIYSVHVYVYIHVQHTAAYLAVQRRQVLCICTYLHYRVYMCTYAHMYIGTYGTVHRYRYMNSENMYTRSHTHAHTHAHAHAHAHTHAHTQHISNVSPHTHTHTQTHTQTHTHTHAQTFTGAAGDPSRKAGEAKTGCGDGAPRRAPPRVRARARAPRPA